MAPQRSNQLGMSQKSVELSDRAPSEAKAVRLLARCDWCRPEVPTYVSDHILHGTNYDGVRRAKLGDHSAATPCGTGLDCGSFSGHTGEEYGYQTLLKEEAYCI